MSGGVAPLTYTLKNGVLPAGTTLSGLTLIGTFKGLPGRLQFTVQVTDGFGVTTSISPTFNMIPHISFSGTVLCQGDFNTACNARIPYAGSTPGGQPSIGIVQVGAYCPSQYAAGCPPAPSGAPGAFNATISGGYVLVSVPARCGGSCGGGYTGAVTLRLTDQSLCAAGTNCSSGTAVVDVWIVAG